MQRGDANAWEALVREHQQAVFRLAWLMLGDADDAEDVAQDTFIKAYKSRERLDPALPVRPWLMRICANESRNRRRSMGRYVAALRRALLNEPEALQAAEVAEHGMRNIDAQVLWQAVRRLRHDDQVVIYLRYFLDMPEIEMAVALRVAQGTVKSRLHRALGRLREVVQRDFPGLHQEFET